MTLILCVEDESALRTDIADELREAGYDVVEAADGVTALDAICSGRPDLILCDVTMPRMNGFELLSVVRAQRPECADVPFVFLTALADRDHVVEGKRRGGDDYLTKPIDFDLMLATVEARVREVARLRDHATSILDMALAEAIASAPGGSEPLLGLLDAMSIGVVFLDADRMVKRINATAQAILAHPEIGSIANGQLRAGFGELADALRSLARRGPGVPPLQAASWMRRHDFGMALICFSPAPGGAATLLLRDPERVLGLPLEHVASSLGLTPAETRIAAGLMQGKDLKTIAEESGVAESTARTQLKAVLGKTDTHRQSELVSLLWRMLLPLGV